MGSKQYSDPPFMSQDYAMPDDPRLISRRRDDERGELMRGFSRAGRQGMDQALAANAQRMGGGSRSSAAGLISDIAAQQGYGQRKALVDLDASQAAERMGLSQLWNNLTNDRNALKMAQYNNMLGMNRQKTAEEQANIGMMLSAMGTGAKMGAGS